MTGRVYLVGAGPGDPRLLTLRGAEALRDADVVVYDRLAPEALLDLAPSSAERIYAVKRPGDREFGLSQDAINDLLVTRAQAGQTVVRLKGGDPFVFGRGGEEALACARAGIDVEIVPGVTSAVAAPAAAGIPLTHRGLASSVAIVTASHAPGNDPDLAALARAADTLVVLMAAAKLEELCVALVAAGRPEEQAAALIERATTSSQRVVAGTLGTLARRAAEAGVAAPATLVAGDVVEIGAALDWAGSSPSAGDGATGDGARDALA